MFYIVFIGYGSRHPATYNIFRLVKDTTGIIPRLCAQSRQHPDLSAALLRLIHTEFNERFSEALERRKRVWWTNF